MSEPVKEVEVEETVEDVADDDEGESDVGSEEASEDEDDEVNEAEAADGSDDESNDEADISTLVHEAASSSKTKKQPASSQKYTPPNESKEDRDRRTIFVGNVSLEAAKAKSGLSKLRAHILTYCPSAKIESVRIRSVPFSSQTGGGDDDEDESGKRAKREKERAKAWRDQQEVLKKGDKKEKEELDMSQSFIDAKGKRKVAFIKKEFHTEADSCNAYVVFAHAHPDRPSNLPPILDPFEAAQKALGADGSSFLERTIRVDVVRLPSSEALVGATTSLKRRDAWTGGADPKKSVFVGGLDYAAKEEDVRVFFEELVKAERGPRSEGDKRWVTSVRLIRDRQTQMGKGFGYVHFADTESVDEVLAIDSAKMRFAKKPLRVQRAKTLPSASGKPTIGPASTSTSGAKGKDKASGKDAKDKSGKAKAPTTAIKQTPAGPVPRGNPKLGEKIRNLSKEDRKVAKSSDADRQARRLAKKKMRGKMGKEMEKGAVKLVPTKSEKERSKKVTAKKSRVRSSRNLQKMKGARE